MIKQSKSLSHIYLVDCDIPKGSIGEIFEAIYSNNHGVGYWLELTSNDLGTKGAKEIVEVIHKHKDVIIIFFYILYFIF